MSAVRTLTSVLVSAGVAAAVRALPEPAVPGWRRTNFRGREVSLTGGLSAALGALAGAAVGGPLRAPALIAGTSALLAGGYDDLIGPTSEQASDKGLGGHLEALRSGRVSGGAVKVGVIGCGSLLAARALRNESRDTGWISVALGGLLIAGCANLMNLFDLRPGRAAKIALTAGVMSVAGGAFSGPVAAVAGASAAALPGDLAEKTMLGDLGANTLGALIGVRLAAGSSRTRVLGAIVVGALTLASERISFTGVIESVPVLRALDELGRQPSPVASTLPMT
jgi:UDP-N-acetylmuramyl pentapeptide phosphotransferase/UDP-N-acetylglucosamine-1-phosphate transferase